MESLAQSLLPSGVKAAKTLESATVTQGKSQIFPVTGGMLAASHSVVPDAGLRFLTRRQQAVLSPLCSHVLRGAHDQLNVLSFYVQRSHTHKEVTLSKHPAQLPHLPTRKHIFGAAELSPVHGFHCI